MSTEQVTDGRLMADPYLTKEQIDSLPAVARIEEKTVTELLTDEITTTTASLLDSGSLGTLMPLISRWEGKDIEKPDYSGLVPYPLRIDLPNNRIEVIERIAYVTYRSIRDVLSDTIQQSIRALIAAWMDSNMVQYDEAIRLYKIWGGDDLSYYKR